MAPISQALTCAVGLLCASTLQQRDGGNTTGCYPDTEALTGVNGHDPSVVKTLNGTYILYGSSGWGDPSGGQGLPTWTSDDRLSWTYSGNVFSDSSIPSATDPYRNNTGALWAPDVTYLGDSGNGGEGTYVLYYAASTGGSERSAVFVATSETGYAGTWKDGGLVVETSTGSGYNAIDPHLVVVSHSSYKLAYGSFWNGIGLIDIDPTTFLASEGAETTDIAKRTDDNGALEGSWILQHGNYFYLFMSWDHCCVHTDSDYNIRVARSSSVEGPYVDEDGVEATNGGGTLVLASHDNIYGPGGEALLLESDGVALFYHYETAEDPQLGINMLDFSSGWPVVTA